MKEITATDLKAAMDSDTPPRLIDVREDWEFQICQIVGSVNIPMQQIPGRVEELARDGDAVAVCHHGARSEQVVRFLEAQGFENMINLVGGIDAWSREVDATVPTY